MEAKIYKEHTRSLNTHGILKLIRMLETATVCAYIRIYGMQTFRIIRGICVRVLQDIHKIPTCGQPVDAHVNTRDLSFKPSSQLAVHVW